MTDELSEKIKLFIAIETNCSEIYSLLNGLCPEERSLWHYLSKVEENHATVSSMAEGYHSAGKLPKDFMDPSLSIAELTKTLKRTEALKKRLTNRNISLDEALEEMLAIENAACKEYFRRTVVEKASNSEIMAKLRKVIWDTDAHVAALKDFIEKKKY
jgi:hypothetical protein